MSETGLILSSDKTRTLSFVPQSLSTSVSVPDSVTNLSKALFSGCSQLVSVKLPNDVQVLPDGLFENCTSLEKIIMPKTVVSLGSRCFANCSSLKTIPFRAGLTELSESVFESCTSLEAVVIPDTVAVIESRAFANCTALKALVLPASLEDLASDAFQNCTSLRHIRISEENPYFRVNPANGCLYKKQEDGMELIVLSPVDFEKSSVTLNQLGNNFTPFFSEDEEEFDDNSDVISIMNAQTILDNDDSSNISNADSTTDFSSSTFTDEESNLVDAAELAEEDFKNFIQEEEAMNTTDAGVRAQEIVSQEARSLDSSYEPVALDELELLSAESEILSQNIHSTGELPNSEEAVLPSNVDALTQHRIAESAERYECIELAGHSRNGKNTLHVFAESLVFEKTEVPHFSKALVQCCKRIAKIRNYSHIHLYYGLPLENDEFAQMLRHFIDDHSVIYACMAENTNSLSETAKKFIEISGISLEKNLVEGANEMAKNDSIAFPKMILQDDYSE